MSDETKKTVKSPVKKAQESSAQILNHLAASAKARGISIRKIVKILLFAILCAAWYLDKGNGTAQYAMLYMIADNAKKSGRADGNVYMRNGRIRGFTVPALVQNTFTQTQRASLGGISSSWNSLTDEQRAGWNSSTGFFASDRFGRQIIISGKTLYVRLNQNLFNIGEAPISNVPLPTDVPGITEMTITPDVSDAKIHIAFSPSPTDTNVTHLLFATAPQSVGTSRPSKSAFRLLTFIPDSSNTPFDLDATDYARLGTLIAGQRIFIKLVPVNLTTGQAGPVLVNSGIVIA